MKVAPFLRPRLGDSFLGENGGSGTKSDHSRARVSSSFTRIVNTPYQVDNEAAPLALRSGPTDVSPMNRLSEQVNVINEFNEAILI